MGQANLQHLLRCSHNANERVLTGGRTESGKVGVHDRQLWDEPVTLTRMRIVIQGKFATCQRF